MPALGRFCLVLHGHIPYVLRHRYWPHGEAWLYEAAAETYLPLLNLLDDLANQNVRVGITVGLTPVLLEQVADDYFKTGFSAYLAERVTRATDDLKQFERTAQPAYAAVARQWQQWYLDRAADFDRIGRDFPKAFAAHHRAGRIEILTSAATHGYLPLLGDDTSVNAQLSIGAATSAKHLGIKPTGLWLPECAYRPADPAWQPPVLHGAPRSRPGLEKPIAAAGLDHFFVDTHLVASAKPLATFDGETTRPTNEALTFWDTKRAWGTPLDPVGVVSEPRPADVYAFARHPRVSEQVWSATIGYPGADEYLDFHHKPDAHGLRYRRITSHHTAGDQKLPYDEKLTTIRIAEQAKHFCSVLRQTLVEHTKETGRVGTIVAPFDAELFGHWWFEGPQFLRSVLLELSKDGSIEVVTTATALASGTVEKVVRLPAGSWGEGGQNHVWLNEQTRWLWEAEYRAELRFRELLAKLPWRTDAVVAGVMQKVARELLLLQSSDWPFVIHSGAAADYGIARFAGHLTRFDRLATIAEGRGMSELQKIQMAEADAHDVIFGDVSLANWVAQ